VARGRGVAARRRGRGTGEGGGGWTACAGSGGWSGSWNVILFQSTVHRAFRHVAEPPPTAGSPGSLGLAAVRAALCAPAGTAGAAAVAGDRAAGGGSHRARVRGLRHRPGGVQPRVGLPAPWPCPCAGDAGSRAGPAVGRRAVPAAAPERVAACAGDDRGRHAGGPGAPGQPAAAPPPRLPAPRLRPLAGNTRPCDSLWRFPPDRGPALQTAAGGISDRHRTESGSDTMGKGDRKTAKGKRYNSSYG